MKVLIAAVSFPTSISGIQRHALNIVRCLLLQPEITVVDLFLAPWQRNLMEAFDSGSVCRLRVHYADIGQGSLRRNLWYYRQLPLEAAELGSDIVHLSYPVPVNAAAFGRPVVVTLHDLYPFEIPGNFRAHKVVFNQLVLKQCLRNADVISCVSDATLSRLKEYMPREVWQKASRIYNCVEPQAVGAPESAAAGWQGQDFLLCVAQHRRNKNIPFLLRVFRRLLSRSRVRPDIKLVVIGIKGPETKQIEKAVSDLNLGRNVLFLEGVSEAELQWFYRHCAALLVPSKAEGFGLPVAEGLLAGCRVICSDIAVLREVGAEHCSFVPLGQGVEEAFTNAVLERLQQAPPGRISLPHLSAETISAEYMALYRRLTASRADAVEAPDGTSMVTSSSSSPSSPAWEEAQRGRI